LIDMAEEITTNNVVTIYIYKLYNERKITKHHNSIKMKEKFLQSKYMVRWFRKQIWIKH